LNVYGKKSGLRINVLKQEIINPLRLEDFKKFFRI